MGNEILKTLLNEYALKKQKAEIEQEDNWDNARRVEAAQDYMKDFRDKIAEQLGIDDPSKITPGQIIDFRKVKDWPQPSWINWKIFY